MAAERSDAPDFEVVAPRCAATDWDQEGALNAYVGKKDLSGYVDGAGRSGFDGAVCGCDPLAWGLRSRRRRCSRSAGT